MSWPGRMVKSNVPGRIVKSNVLGYLVPIYYQNWHGDVLDMFQDSCHVHPTQSLQLSRGMLPGIFAGVDRSFMNGDF